MHAKTKAPRTVGINRLFPIRAIGPGIGLLAKDRFVAILEASPIHFGLRSPEEQDRLVMGYRAFLNGLQFPIQILIRSDLLRVDEYVADLKSREDEMDAELRPSFSDYLRFIREAADLQHLLRRRFFLVLSWQGFDSRSRPKRRGDVLWAEAEQELLRRQQIIAQGLGALGIRVRALESEEMFHILHAGLSGGKSLPSGVAWQWGQHASDHERA